MLSPSPAPVGVVLLQLGTPDAPDTPSVRRYLREFLSDRRVIDISRALWLPLLHGVILRTRPAKSAALYRRIWTPKGSPLAVISANQARGLQQRLAADGIACEVAVAMRYGNPTLRSVLDDFQRRGIERVLAFPMYPQYAGATTGSSLEQLFGEIALRRVVPSVRVVPPYFDDPQYIAALAAGIRRRVERLPRVPDALLLSFHGLPKRYADAGDPYPAQCHATAAALTAALGWPASRVRLTFQSRFGREEWLQPYTAETLTELGGKQAHLLVACPGFTADCLETIEEIGITGKEDFLHAGGASFERVPCVNTSAAWLDAMAAIARRELAGWA